MTIVMHEYDFDDGFVCYVERLVSTRTDGPRKLAMEEERLDIDAA